MAGEGGIPGAALPGTTVGSDVGAAAADLAGVQPTEEGSFFQSVLYNVMANMPKARTTMGWNAYRMSNSLLHGGFGGNTGALRNHLHPRALLRVTDPNAVINNARMGGNGYSMFNIAGLVNNGIGRGGLGGVSAIEARRSQAAQAAFGDTKVRGQLMAEMGGDSRAVNEAMRARAVTAGDEAVRSTRGGRLYSQAVGKGWVTPGMDAYEAGVLSKVTTGMRLGRGVATKGGGLAAEYAMSGMSARTAASHYLAGAFTSRIGAGIGGYMAGARFGGTAVEMGLTRTTLGAMAGNAGEVAAGQTFTRGAQAATNAFKAGGIEVVERAGGRAGATMLAHEGGRTGIRAVGAGMRTAAAGAATKQAGRVAAGRVLGASAARAAGGFVANPLVGAAMTAWMVYDIAKIGFGIIRDANKRAAERAREAAKSFKGQIEKPVFGMGFVDNEVAATARSRGVQAIQNSRLNARSILGAEAGPLAAHFG
jgi:hypothetical protein